MARRLPRMLLAGILGGLLAAIVITCARQMPPIDHPDRRRLYIDACMAQLRAQSTVITALEFDACMHDQYWQGRRSCPNHPRGYHRTAPRVLRGGGR